MPWSWCLQFCALCWCNSVWCPLCLYYRYHLVSKVSMFRPFVSHQVVGLKHSPWVVQCDAPARSNINSSQKYMMRTFRCEVLEHQSNRMLVNGSINEMLLTPRAVVVSWTPWFCAPTAPAVLLAAKLWCLLHEHDLNNYLIAASCFANSFVFKYSLNTSAHLDGPRDTHFPSSA